MTKLSALLYFVTAFVPYEALVVIHRSRSFSKHQEDRRIARTVIYTSEKSDNDDDDIILGAKDEAVPSDLKEQVLAALLADDEKEDEKEDEKREVKKSGVITLNLSANSGKWKAQNKKKKKNEGRSRALSRIAEFGLRPREVREHLDRYVIRQDAAKKVLSVAICDHYNVVKRCLSDAREREAEYSKPNILLLGPSGSGKTYIMRTLAKLLGVPFVKADATKFTEAGIVGEDAEDLVRELVQRADNDVELAQYGIIYVDEIDKLCGGGHGRDGGAGFVGGGVVTNSPQRGVQSSFLKIMEDTEITIHKPFSPELLFGGSDSGRSTGPSKISTKHILFIFSGAFTGLDATLRKNREYRGLGFDSDLTSNNNNNIYATQKIVDSPLTKSYLGEATSADLIRAGLEPEFVGRVPVRVAVEQLSARDLEEILQNSQGSVLKQYERDFSGYGIELDIRPEFIRAIALQAAQENTGARGLVTVLERTFRDFKYTLPCAGIHTLLCTERTVLDPATDLTHLLKSLADPQEADHVRRNDVRRFAKDLGRAAGGLDLFFSTEATISLLAQSKIEDLAVTTICKRSLGWDILEIAERILPQDKTNAHDDDDDDDDDDQLISSDGSNLLLLKVDENGLSQASANDIVLDDDDVDFSDHNDDFDNNITKRIIANPVLEALLEYSEATGQTRIELPLGLVQDAQARAQVLLEWKQRAAEAAAVKEEEKIHQKNNKQHAAAAAAAEKNKEDASSSSSAAKKKHQQQPSSSSSSSSS
uniref:AAA+ ATPase domain-containing protein n=1 Tax=Aureoumbra lagunensis TaxID=44058 RepID=A0A7S3JYG7_9STRA